MYYFIHSANLISKFSELTYVSVASCSMSCMENYRGHRRQPGSFPCMFTLPASLDNVCSEQYVFVYLNCFLVQVRGDPDGCVRGAAARVELPAEGLLNMRKGWLLRQLTAGAAPARHWFVLRGAALLYYRDPSAEDCGIMDGVIDLNGVANITESPPARTFGFVIKVTDTPPHYVDS